ncbi:MAG: VCBS repeat-containing protein [Verrucomicrobia bacterium]|nr:VCBS repeat-containing protein [Verrucomicrobiota bacterium]
MGTTNGMFATSGPSPEQAAVTQLWRNTGNGFSLVLIPGLPRCYLGKVAWGDFDNDGRPDFIITGESASGKVSQVWRNTGIGFVKLTIPGFSGDYGGMVELADYNNDGWLDFIVSGGAGDAVTQLWRNTGGNFALDPVDNLSQVGVPSIAWADYDRDGRQDFLITGFNGNLEPGSQYFAELWQNLGAVTNSPPSSPTELSVVTSAGVTTFTWSPATDDHTPPAGVSYNLRIGTQPGREDILWSHSDVLSGFRRVPAPGNAGARTNFQIRLPRGNYFASVQAVDSAMAGGSFSAEIAFSTLPTLNVVHQNDQLVVSWTEPESGYVLESSTSLEPASWQPQPAGSNSPVMIDPSETQRFFRLRKP